MVEVKWPTFNLDDVETVEPSQGQEIFKQLLGYMITLRHAHGVKHVFGIMTTYEKWVICWLPEADDLARSTVIPAQTCLPLDPALAAQELSEMNSTIPTKLTATATATATSATATATATATPTTATATATATPATATPATTGAEPTLNAYDSSSCFKQKWMGALIDLEIEGQKAGAGPGDRDARQLVMHHSDSYDHKSPELIVALATVMRKMAATDFDTSCMYLRMRNAGSSHIPMRVVAVTELNDKVLWVTQQHEIDFTLFGKYESTLHLVLPCYSGRESIVWLAQYPESHAPAIVKFARPNPREPWEPDDPDSLYSVADEFAIWEKAYPELVTDEHVCRRTLAGCDALVMPRFGLINEADLATSGLVCHSRYLCDSVPSVYCNIN